MFKFDKEKRRAFFQKLSNIGNEEESTYRHDFADGSVDFAAVIHEEPEETKNPSGELAVDIYQTNTEVIIQTMPAGVRSDELSITITPNTIVISGKREAPQGVPPENYMLQELYWGAFSRTIVLPVEVEPQEAEAIEKHGLLVIRLPKVDKSKQHRLKIKSV